MRNPLCNILAALFLSTAITIAISVRLNKDRTDVGLNRRPIARTGGEPVPLSADRGDRPLSPLGVRTSPADEPQPARDSGRRGPIDPERSLDGAVAAFDRWIEEYLAAPSSQAREAMECAGESLAQARRQALAALIESDPRQALRVAVPTSLRRQLPASVLAHLEERVSAQAKYEVIAVLGNSGEPHSEPTIQRRVIIQDKTYRAFVYGRRLQQTTKDRLPLHGIALGDALAVDESPIRVLPPEEARESSLPLGNGNGLCPVSRQAATGPVAVEAGGEIFHLCRSGHIASFRQSLEEEQSAIGPDNRIRADGPVAGSSWTHGPKRLLFMRVIFPEALTASISDADADRLLGQANDFITENSYGATTLAGTVTSLLTLPNSAAWYAYHPYQFELLDDARQAAAAAGYAPDSYDLDCVHSIHVAGFGDHAKVGAKGIWLQATDAGTLCHELGHNFGLMHANAWLTTDGSVIGAGTNYEYQNVFDTMGLGARQQYQFNACHKHILGWLPDSAIQTVTSGGVYRLEAFDTGALADGPSYALRIRMDQERDYWIETRQRVNVLPGSGPGLLISWSPWSQSNGGSQLLDTTPGSGGGRYDAQLLLGRTFFDPVHGLKITPVQLGGTTAQSIDIIVSLVRTRLEVHAEPNGDCTILLTDMVGSGYVIEASSDFVSWETVGTVTNTTGRSQITDTSAHQHNRRLYRAVAL